MDQLICSIKTTISALRCLMMPEFAPYVKTAGTVLLGWIIVSWIWNIIVILFAPAAVSALAVLLICPKTLEWFICLLGPSVENTICDLMEKIGLGRVYME